jgi:hypothetical protein
VHAAGESSPGNLPRDTHAVVLAVPNEEALLKLSRKLTFNKVTFVEIHEPEPPHNGALMALGVVPGRKEELYRLMSSLPLLR